MIDPDDYWVNNPLITPINKALMYDNDVWAAYEDGQDRAIDILNKATGHNGKTHYEGIQCWFCNAVTEIKEGIYERSTTSIPRSI